MKILVTGANGFIGRKVSEKLRSHNHTVLAMTRNDDAPVVGEKIVYDFARNVTSPPLENILERVDAIVHTIGLTHDSASESVGGDAFNAVNVEISARLAGAAINSRVKSFVYLSSVKAVGESTLIDEDRQFLALNDSSPARPQSRYGQSKFAAEQRLNELLADTVVQLTILRPPLIYGVGQKGNMRTLFELVKRRLPLPFRSVRNKRSLLCAENLCEAIEVVLNGEWRGSSPYFIADKSISTPELIKQIGSAIGVRPMLLSLPQPLMRLGGRALGKAVLLDKVTDSLLVDDERFRLDYGWQPKVGFQDALREIAADLAKNTSQ